MKKESTPSFRCLVVDDELRAQHVLSGFIAETSWLDLVGCCSDAEQAIEMVVVKMPDIIFLDVEMPGLSGLDLLKAMPLPRPHIILVTAFREYALEAFEYEVAGFLLKPVSRERFLKTVLKITIRYPQDFLALEAPNMESGQHATTGSRSGAYNDNIQSQGFIWVRSNGKFHRIPHWKILAVEALKDYIKIYMTQASGMLLVRENIGRMEQRLPGSDFIRIHRSFIINRHQVKTIEGNMVTMEGGEKYQISDSQRRDIIVKLLTRE